MLRELIHDVMDLRLGHRRDRRGSASLLQGGTQAINLGLKSGQAAIAGLQNLLHGGQALLCLRQLVVASP